MRLQELGRKEREPANVCSKGHNRKEHIESIKGKVPYLKFTKAKKHVLGRKLELSEWCAFQEGNYSAYTSV